MILEEGVRSQESRRRSQESGVRSQESGEKKKEEGVKKKITHDCANIIYCESLH
ncbi:hypothetical protein PN450_20305 [Dolichospermum lemmermannii CS-548]|uniref:hypothetical protein n=1 Tax=Dolichospermum lemmermannii TaxID=54295 RepID=UPI00232DD843|nr:hypothetical protein [Dolichospermum lemmermannii]MDB9439082.1 hypothetical protein [Dolichospermum lemmermannii CS-548]